MNFVFRQRKTAERTEPEKAPAASARPGLPVSLAGSASIQDNAVSSARDVAREAAAARRRDEAKNRDAGTGPTEGGSSGKGKEAETGEQEKPDNAQEEISAGGEEAVAEGGGGGEGEPTAAVTTAPVGPAAAGPPDAFRSVDAPVLSPTPIPDLSRIRSPVVLPPPADVVRRSADILRSTGSTPEGHHAQVQRGIDSVADRARAAERNVIFQVGGIAANARHAIEALADRIPGIVGGNVARIRATAMTAIADINQHADTQIKTVIAFKGKMDAGLAVRGKDTELDMHRMLMKEAPEVLKKAKAKMDEELGLLAGDAGARIAGIKSGIEPVAMDTGVKPEPGAKPADKALADNGEGGEQYSTWPAAREALTNKLLADLPTRRTVQYGNLQCAAAVPPMVEAQQRAYEAANQETIKGLTSDENRARFFDITMGLIMPTVGEEKERAVRTADESYTGHLDENLTEQYSHLDNATQRIVRQIDEKRSVLVDETLNPDKAKSLPAQSIKGLQDAGRKIMDGLRDQARIVEASLKANLASLAAQYPDLVARLEPLVTSGDFLEATATLAQLAEAEKSIGGLEQGQISAVAEQAITVLANARKGFDGQVASLYKMTAASIDSLNQTLARTRYDFVRTTMLYTGIMDKGVVSVFPQILEHGKQVAERLLGPKNSSDQQFSNIKTSAIGYMNGVMSGEWQGYLARVNGMEKGFGGVAGADAWFLADSSTEFGRIRNGATFDAMSRGSDVRSALTPPPMTTGERIGGYMFMGLGALAYDIYSDPNESKVTTALSIPWPGPCAVDEMHKVMTGTGVIQLIRERMKSEEEQADILKLFDPNPNERAAGKAGLLAGSSASTGINNEAAMALSQSLTADELASPIMSPAMRQKIAEELRDTLKPADMEIAASYLNGEPDQALAIRMRQLFDKQGKKQEKDQLQTGEELDKLIRQELFGGGQYAYVPQARLDSMRDAAFLRFDEVSREGHKPVTVRDAPVAPPSDRLALSPAQLRYQGRPPPPPPPPPKVEAKAEPDAASKPASKTLTLPGVRPPASAPPAPKPAPRPQRAIIGPEAPNEVLTPEGIATDRSRKLDAARLAIVAYMNKPHTSYYRRGHDPRAEEDLRRYSAMDRRVRTYDPGTGRVDVAPALAVQAYNNAIIMHGTNSPEAMGAKAAASYSRISGDRSLSNNQINELNQNFSNSEYARFKARWDHATPAQRVAMGKQWEEVQAKHRTFLRETARGMGMTDKLDDPAAVQAFVSGRLGSQFAKEGERYRKAGSEITENGRISIDTGVALASGGDWDGTNEALMQNVLANRTKAEFNVRRANGETMHDYAYRMADNEMSGDDWHQAKEKLRGEDENEFERYETLLFLKDQQMEEGTGDLGKAVMAGTWQKSHLEDGKDQADKRLKGATKAGIEDYNARMIAAKRPDLVIDPIPDIPVRLPTGQINPLVTRFAVNGDGKLRGDGPSMDVLQTNTRQAAGFYQDEIDRNESIFTSLITALAVIVSVILLIIPGVNLIAAGILVALLSGAATIAVKSGMRGGRYGWEEMVTDIGITAIEAATAGFGGAMSKGAGAAAKAAQTGTKMAKLGRVASVGARIQMRFGPVAAPIIQGAITGAASTAATAALDDKLWDDGIGAGIGRVLGNAVKGGMSGAANAAVTGAITRGLDRRLAPVTTAKGATPGRLNKLGRSLGPGGREMLTELISNTVGSLSGESLNILADIAMDKHVGGWQGALERLGKAGLRELVYTAGRTGVQQVHRANYNKLSAELHGNPQGADPAKLRLLNRLGQSAGVVPLGIRTEDFAREFSAVHARIAEMPAGIGSEVAKMSPDKAMAVIRMLDSGQLGNREQRLAFTMHLGKEVAGLDVGVFDRALIKANDDFAPNRRARRDAISEANRQVMSGIRGPERARLQGLELADLAGLPPPTLTRLAQALAEGGADFHALAHQLIPGDAGLATRVANRMTEAGKSVTEARAAVGARRARIRDDLAEATPGSVKERVAGLRPRDAEILHAALRQGEPTGFARAAGILREAGLDTEGANRLARHMINRIQRTSARVANLDNVPPQHRRAMLDMSDDALMEIRVAQFVRRPLSDVRIDEMVAATAARRPGTDRTALAEAIRQTMATRHGRPGFREALTQKRAFLDMIPFGMKRVVHRTPVLTLPEESFLAYVRGKGNEHAVTLIVNGEPVVLIRQGADPRVLAEEGLHVLQYHDPKFRERVQSLGEGKMAQWDDLDLDTQVRAYRTKLDIEIDGQQRMIAKLRARADDSFFSSSRRQARDQLETAEDTLRQLVDRRGRAAALSQAEMDRIVAGIENPPSWLRQPARMFAKSPADNSLINEIHPTAKTPVRNAFRALTKRVPEMSNGDRRQLLQILHGLAEVVPPQQLVAALGRIRSTTPGANDPLAKIPANRIAVAFRDHFLETGDSPQLAGVVRQVGERLEAKKGLSPAEAQLFKATLQRLAQDEPVGTHKQLEIAKRAIILSLHRMPANMPDEAVIEHFRNIARVLGVGRIKQLDGLDGKPAVQAAILEALAGPRPPAVSQGYFKSVRDLLNAGIADFPDGADLKAFQLLTRAYFENTPNDTFERIVNLVRASGETMSAEALNFVLLHPSRITEILPKISGLMTSIVDIDAGPKAKTAAAGKVTVKEMLAYFQKALKSPEIRASLIRMGRRADQYQQLSDANIEAIRTGKPIPTGPEDFIARHSKALSKSEEEGDYVPIVADPEQAAAKIMARFNAKGSKKGAGASFVMTIEEARAIAKRLEVLETSAAFSALTGNRRSRDDFIDSFFNQIRSLQKGTDDASRNDRGEEIEVQFRRFVRQRAIETARQIIEGGKMPGATEPLSKEARVALANLLIRGANDVKKGVTVDDTVKADVDKAVAAMRHAYLAASGLSGAKLKFLGRGFTSLVDRGVIETEELAKGKMQEGMIEALLELSSGKKKTSGVPELYDEVSSASRTTTRSFQSVDQETDASPRSTDHVLKVEKTGKLPPGMETDDLIQTDSKAGAGAFDDDQFKRYFVEMARAFAGNRSLDPDGGLFEQSSAKSLAYITDNHENLIKTQRQVMRALQDILTDPNAKQLVITIAGETYNLTALYGITPAKIRANADKFVVHFGRIAQADDAHAPANASKAKTSTDAPSSSHLLGPFLFQTFHTDVAEMIRQLLDPKSAINRSRKRPNT